MRPVLPLPKAALLLRAASCLLPLRCWQSLVSAPAPGKPSFHLLPPSPKQLTMAVEAVAAAEEVAAAGSARDANHPVLEGILLKPAFGLTQEMPRSNVPDGPAHFRSGQAHLQSSASAGASLAARPAFLALARRANESNDLAVTTGTGGQARRLRPGMRRQARPALRARPEKPARSTRNSIALGIHRRRQPLPRCAR